MIPPRQADTNIADVDRDFLCSRPDQQAPPGSVIVADNMLLCAGTLL
jgi:hypothetical protein